MQREPRPLLNPIATLRIERPDVCGGCGWCCERMGTPPLEAMSDLDAMPAVLRDELLAYREDLRTHPHTLSREVQNLPCSWWDERDRVCKHYEHRPPICRDFEIGGDECVAFRRWKLAVLTGKPLPALPIPPHPGRSP